ncbi:MAG: B12-binding domain-containing radical SAM protein [Candidatus Bathyarchaeota archaeon]|jgi:magnesium-protoporphyrin IX monomethyl ester (oxidative) cyclase|nr:B12-binding domain-containing radical SAM protein [Candidatus Bathyarchaeota archaeon]
MRICLINPPRIHPKLWGIPSAFQPLDIAYVASLLEKSHKVMIIDSPTEGLARFEKLDEKKYRIGLKEEELEKRIKQWSPDLVGITVPFSGWSKTAFETVCSVKKVDEDIPIFLEGLHASARHASCLKNSKVDYVVIGEPENTVYELASLLELGRSKKLEEVRGLAFSENGKTIITPPRLPIEDLDSLPFPARHLLPMEKYFSQVRKKPLRGEIFKPWASVLTSRGCPYNCVFCTVHIVMGKKWRGRSPENVVEELEQLIQTYKIKQIDFTDDNMTFDRKRMERICDLIVEHGLDIEWFTGNGVRADTLDENLLRKMKLSGCRNLRLAPESGVQRVVDQIVRKNLDLRRIEQAVVWCQRIGIKVGCFFVIGLIGETRKDIEATIEYARKLKRLGANRFYFSFAMPQYGTELYKQAKKGGYLRSNFNDDALSAAQPLIETNEFTINDLLILGNEGNKINSIFTQDKLAQALRNPVKTLRVLFGKRKNS